MSLVLVNWNQADELFFKRLKEKGLQVSALVCHDDKSREYCKLYYQNSFVVCLMKDFIHHHKKSAYLKEILEISGEPWDLFDNKALNSEFWLNTLSMATRHYGTYGWTTVQDKIHYMLKCLAFWRSFLQYEQVSTVIFNNNPHEVDDYILFSVAESLNIKTYIVQHILAKPLCVIRESPHEDPINPQHILNELPLLKRHQSDMLIKKLAKQYLTGLSSDIAYRPEDLQEYKINLQRQAQAINRAYQTSGSDSLGQKFASHLKLLSDYYHKNSVSVVPSKPFVYFPLHFQPEETTSPGGNLFTEQRLAIQIISQSVPDGWKVLVKEHPMQFAPPDIRVYPYRSVSYYQDILNLPNTNLVRMSVKSSRLIQECTAVATITGTAGLEAILGSKPVLYFGNPWYAHMKGATSIKSYKEALAFFEQYRSDALSETRNLDEVLSFFLKYAVLPSYAGTEEIQSYFDKSGKVKISSELVFALVRSTVSTSIIKKVVEF